MIRTAILLGIGGLLVGTAITWLVTVQTRTPGTALWRRSAWVPLLGTLRRRDWVGLAVELVTVAMTVALFMRHGLTVRFGLLWLGAVVLIDTGAVDWKVKLIDVLVLLVATLIAVATAPYRHLNLIRSLEGLATALVLFLLFFVLAKILYPRQNAPFGLGDVYLGAFIGALVGFYDLPGALFYGMVLAGVASIGLIVVRGYARARHVALSYGTYLCLGTILYLAFGPYR